MSELWQSLRNSIKGSEVNINVCRYVNRSITAHVALASSPPSLVSCFGEKNRDEAGKEMSLTMTLEHVSHLLVAKPNLPDISLCLPQITLALTATVAYLVYR